MDDWPYVSVRQFAATLIVGVLCGLALIGLCGLTIALAAPQ